MKSKLLLAILLFGVTNSQATLKPLIGLYAGVALCHFGLDTPVLETTETKDAKDIRTLSLGMGAALILLSSYYINK